MLTNNRLSSLRLVSQLSLALLLSAFSRGDELQLLWQIAPGDRTYITTGNTERGVAYNPITKHVLVVSRSDATIYILDAETGADVGTLNMGDGIVSGGTFPMNMIGVSDDGVIYMANLSTSTTAPFLRVYRWASEAAEAPTVAFEGDPAGANEEGVSNNPQRWGDSMDVRGAGASTQILFGSNAGSVAALLTTTDGETFTSKLITEAQIAGALGVSFGAGNTIWTKKGGASPQPLRHVQFDPATGAGTVLHEFPSSQFPATIGQVDVNGASNILAAIAIETPDNVKVYDISDLSAPPVLIDAENFPADNANGNAVGSVVATGDLIFALDTNNGLVAYRLIESVTAPSFVAPLPPATLNIIEGGYARIALNVSGTAPFTYRWSKDGTVLASETGSQLLLTNVTGGTAGAYEVIVSNSAASITNTTTVAITPSTRSARATELWRLPAGSRAYLGEANNDRGIAYNPANGHLLVASRAGGLNIYVLDGATGAELHKLQVPTDVVTGGTFAINMLAVADDGAVYVANLVTGGTGYRIYRWANDAASTVPTVAYEGDDGSGLRLGDTFDARGSGVNTQLLAGHNETTAAEQPEPPAAFIVYTTADGETFTANRFEVADAPAGSSRLGAAFGEGNTVFAKAPNHPLRQFSFDLAAASATLSNTFDIVNPAGIGPIGYDPVNKLLGGISVLTTPDNLELYQLDNAGTNLTLVDQDFFASDNPNPNGVGSVDFGGGNVYALDVNNGLIALKINPPGSEPTAPALSAPDMNAGAFSFTLTGTANASYKIEATSDFETWTEVSTVTAGAGGTVQVTDNSTQPRRFYRAVAQ